LKLSSTAEQFVGFSHSLQLLLVPQDFISSAVNGPRGESLLIHDWVSSSFLPVFERLLTVAGGI
jgi:hypothetical protein